MDNLTSISQIMSEKYGIEEATDEDIKALKEDLSLNSELLSRFEMLEKSDEELLQLFPLEKMDRLLSVLNSAGQKNNNNEAAQNESENVKYEWITVNTFEYKYPKQLFNFAFAASKDYEPLKNIPFKHLNTEGNIQLIPADSKNAYFAFVFNEPQESVPFGLNIIITSKKDPKPHTIEIFTDNQHMEKDRKDRIICIKSDLIDMDKLSDKDAEITIKVIQAS